MNYLVSFFIPSLLGIWTLEKLEEKELKRRDFIFYYLMMLLFTNTISIIISNLLFGLDTNLEASLVSSPIFSVKYILVSIIVSIFLSITIVSLKKYISISLKTEKNKGNKNEKKKK